MSTFQVRLVNPTQGSGYASDPSVVNGVSAQKTVELNGPNLTRRRVNDGDIFTETNYYKRYCPISEGGTLTNDEACLHLVSDDGTIWSDHRPNDNKLTVVQHLRMAAGSTFTDAGNQIDIMSLYGGYASSLEIITDEAIKVEFNGNHNAILDVAAGSETFDDGDLQVSLLRFDNSGSGSTWTHVQVMMGIRINSQT